VIVNYAEIFRFCKKFFARPTIGGDMIIPLSLRLSGINFDILAQD
jgi:hypothetical protein